MKHSQIDVGRAELHVVELGTGRPVLFCHGFPDVWIGWRRQMEAIADAGYRAIAIDMRGYGRSTGPDDPGAYTMFHVVGDLVGLLNALDLPNVTLVGHDFGAAACWHAGLIRPDRFNALFAISVPFFPPGGPSIYEGMEAAGKADGFYMFRQRAPEAPAQWTDAKTCYPAMLYWTSATPAPDDRWDPFDDQRPMYRPAPVSCPPWADPQDMAYAVAEFERTGFKRPLHYYYSLQPFSEMNMGFKGVTINQPSFFLVGEADGVNKMRPVDEAAMYRSIPGLRGVRVLHDVGHWVHREAPDATNQILLNFLNGLDI